MSVKRREDFMMKNLFLILTYTALYSLFFYCFFFLLILQMIFSQRSKKHIFFLVCNEIPVFCAFWDIWKQVLDNNNKQNKKKRAGKIELLQPPLQHNPRTSQTRKLEHSCGIWPWCWSDHVGRLQLGTAGCSETHPSNPSGMLINCFIFVFGIMLEAACLDEQKC